jgi:hypothetical protein
MVSLAPRSRPPPPPPPASSVTVHPDTAAPAVAAADASVPDSATPTKHAAAEGEHNMSPTSVTVAALEIEEPRGGNKRRRKAGGD